MIIKRGPTVISLFLVLIMVFNLLSTPVFALMMESRTATGMTLTTGDGSTVTADESWEVTFPYGTFAFETGQIAVTEHDGAQTIRVYRLGGTKGKAQLTLSLTPVVTETEKGQYSFANAAGINDFTVDVEDTLPIALYQAWGIDAPPLKPDPSVGVTGVVETANVLGDDGETVIEYGNTILTANTEADSYRWQAYSNGEWLDIEGKERTLDISNEAAEMSDFRCIYTAGGQEYCTDSLWGVKYEPDKPGGGEIPEGLDLAPAQAFHKLELNAGEYGTYEFYMTFAEGEWVKEIQITPVDDELPESVELVALKMESAMGGELYDTANTLLFAIEDNEEALPSSFSFKTKTVTADKAAGSAFLTVERTGALQYVATVDYKTVSGTATPGVDYADTSSTLYFAGGVKEMTIEIPLINDGIVAQEAGLEFTVALDNPLGGKGTEIIDGVATVSLYNTAKAREKNLATMLYTPDADDVSGDTDVTSNAIAPTSGETILAAPVKPEAPVAAELAFGPEEGEIGTLDYNATAMRVKFDRSAFPLSTYWSNYANLGGMAGNELNDNQKLSFKGWDSNQIKTVTYSGQQWAYRSVECGSDYSNRDFWNTQTFANFDQMFTQVNLRYRADTDTNWGGDEFVSTVFLGVVQNTKSDGMPTDPQPYEKKVADGYGGTDTGGTPNYVNTPRELSYPVGYGAKGIFVAFGDRDSGWASTGTANAKIWLQSKATRRYLEKPLQYVIHTADDDAIKALGTTEARQVYEGIAPSISMAAGAGGTYDGNNLYIGSTLNFSQSPLNWSTYQYIQQNASTDKYPIYLSSSNTKRMINTGSVSGAGSLNIMGSRGWSFASGAPYGTGQLAVSDSYSVNLVFDRQQKIAVDVSKSVPRPKGDGRTIDENINEAKDTFWSRADITVKGAEFKRIGEDGQAGVNGAKAIFESESRSLVESNFGSGSGIAATTLTSNLTYNNIKTINFGLPAEDQILFNGVLYNGNEDIPIPVSMFGMNTIAFTYYHADYITAISDMTMIVNRIEQYIDANGNGQLDGSINQYNQFETVAVNGVKDVLAANLTEEEYAIGQFTPVTYEGQTRQQFFKFYYSLSPACLSVPAGAKVEDRAQILPAFVNAETDESRRGALSNEMQGYRFIQSGQYSNDFNVRNNEGDITITHKAGQYSADGKLMYGPEANAVETVDIPLGGDYNPVPPTYVYSDGKKTEESKTYDANRDEANGWYISDVKFKRSDWDPSYQGRLLYKFAAPEPVFVSDPLVGEALPVADLVSKASEDKYDVSQLNRYLGSFNPTDAVMIGVRQQEFTSNDIIGSFEGLSLLGDVIQSGEHVISVDSVTFGGFSTIPDASGLRRTAGPEKGAKRNADSGNSSNSNPEFNMDLGIEMPSLSVGLTDFVTLIVDGEEFGFSIGIPIFSMERKAENYTSHEASQGHSKSKFGSWEKKTPGSEIVENATKVKDTFANPGSLINSEDWQASKNRAKALDDGNKFRKQLDPTTDTDNLVKSKNMSFSVAVNVTVMFKWSAPDHTFKFSSAMVFLQVGFQFKQTIRLTVCPIVYAYFCVGVSLEVAGGVVNEREVIENQNAAIDINRADGIHAVGAGGSDYANGKAIEQAANLSKPSPHTPTWVVKSDEAASGRYVMAGEKGDAFTFWSKSDALNLYFSGKVKIEVFEEGDWKNLGYVASDGTGPVFIMFDEKVDGTANLNVRITVLDESANFDRIIPISGVRNETFFSGVAVSPSVFLEVGAGIGVEVLKVEVYFKANIGISFSFATRENNAATKGTQLRDPSSSSLSLAGAEYAVKALDDTISALDSDVEAFSFDSFTFRAGFGVRVVLLLFNFELDVIQFGIDYRKSMDKSQEGSPSDGFKDSGWKFAWYALNGGKEITSYSLGDIDDSEGFPGVKITLPSNTFTAQQLYGPENAQMVIDEISALAFDPTNLPTKEFQISGYSSSGDAFRLADNLATGTDYQLLTVGNENYLLYTISRENPTHAVDSNMLVLSKLQNTGEKIGLVNPVNPESEIPYIVVDNDNTGDLDFSASVMDDVINAVWVSYQTETSASGIIAPTVPDASVPRPSYVSEGNTIYMDGANYKDEGFKVTNPGDTAPGKPESVEVTQAPAVVTAVDKPTEPIVGDYYLTAADYSKLDVEEDKAKYSQAADDENYYIALAYESYELAKAAYDLAESNYNAAKTAYEAYQKYLTDLAAWLAWENYRNYPGKKAAYDAYDAWYAYYNGSAQAAADERELLLRASQNTQLKTASLKVTDLAFSPPEVTSGAGAAYLFQPHISDDGNLAFYARSNNFGETEKTQETVKAKAYYDASKGDFTTGSDGVSTGEGDPTAAFRYAYTTSMNDVYGKNTQFMFTYNKDGVSVETGFTPNGWDELGMRLTNSSMTMIGDNKFYLAYTASVTETTVKDGSFGDTTVHKLYLQKGSVGEDGKVVLEPAKMLRQLVDINGDGMNAALLSGLQTIAQTTGDGTKTADGVYVNDGSGAKQKIAFEDPYFGNVRFLKGKLGSLEGTEEDFGESLAFTALDDAKSTFLLFEMNGNTYVVPETSLSSITGAGTGTGRGRIIPFWETDEKSRTRSNAVIGADGDGNISAVYTDAIAGTTNNALYVSKYDPGTASFGLGRMLAMNYMQVYEDGISNNWTQKEMEQAFYGKRTGYKNGGMSTFTFSNPDIALGIKKTGIDGDKSTLVILTQGTQVALTEMDYVGPEVANNDGVEKVAEKVIVPKYKDGVLQSTTGYYALSFGVGEKAIGEGQILFPVRDFSPGAILQPTIEFKNTGDVPLRGSKTAPITLQLWISGQPNPSDLDGTPLPSGNILAEWKIETNVAVGQPVRTGYDENLEGLYTTPLPTGEDLVGRKFYFTVSETGLTTETPDGVEDPIQYSSMDEETGGTVRVIEAMPELAVEDVKFSTVGAEGDKVQIAVSMTVTNRGGADAAAPYLQFTHQTGRTMEEVKEGDTDYQKAIYDPLDISESIFEISRQVPITTLDASTVEELRKGILQLVGTDPTEPESEREKLARGCARTVDGTFWVSKDAYCLATATGSLNIKVEVFNGEETIGSLSAAGTQATLHNNEYNATNNSEYSELNPVTFFTAPAKVTVPLSTTMRLSVPAVTTEQGNPVITVKELNLEYMETTEKYLGILYYNMGADGTGKNGYLVISPSSEGSGVIRVIDSVTGSYTDIAFTVTKSGSGVNIFRDNNIFTWYNALGKEIDPEKDSGVWSFREKVSTWGGSSSNPEDLPPYLSDLSRALVPGASFTFITLAEEIDLYFNGTASVACEIPGFKGGTITAGGGVSYATIKLGENPAYEPRRVKITATAAEVDFDRMVERFAGGRDILPDPGSKAPQIWFSRSLPETASLRNSDYEGGKDGFALTAYVLDETGIATLTFDPGTANATTVNPKVHSSIFRQFDIIVRPTGSIGTFTISAMDESGQSTSMPVMVDWFNTTVNDQNKDEPLSPFNVGWVYRSNQTGELLGSIDETQQLKKDENAFVTVNTAEGATVAVEYYSASTIIESTTYQLVEKASGVFKLVKTVKRTDETGSGLGSPEVTETDATAGTAVPPNTQTFITNAEWKPVAAQKTEYPVAYNAVYKVTAAKGGISATRLFLMNRLNSDLPTIEIAYVSTMADEGAHLSYIARKGAGSQSGIGSISINGYAVYTADAEYPGAVSGDFPISYGGVYNFTVTDTAGNEGVRNETVSLPIQTAGDHFLKVERPYGGLSNGRVTIDRADIFGGVYNTDISNLATNNYGNAYEYALTEKDDAVSKDSEGFDACLNELAWQEETEFSSLGTGEYVLYIRDKLDKSVDCFIHMLKVEDGTVKIDSTVILDDITKKPSITATAKNGGGVYEFIAIPRPNENAMLTASEIEWTIADYAAGAWTKMEGAVSSAKAGIVRSKSALDTFEEALTIAKVADTEKKISWTEIESAVTTAKAIHMSPSWEAIDQALTDANKSDPTLLPDSGAMILLLSEAAGTAADYMAALTDIESAVRSAVRADNEKIINWNKAEQTAAALKAEETTFTQARGEIEGVLANRIVWQQVMSGNTYTWHDCETGWYQIAVRDKEAPVNMASKSVYAGKAANSDTPSSNNGSSSSGINIPGTNISGYIITTPTGAPPVADAAGNITLPAGGTISMPDGTVINVPGKTTINSKGVITVGAGSATIALPGGDRIAGGKGGSDDTVLTVPGGTAIAKDGKVSLPAGKSASVTLPGGLTMSLRPGLTLAIDRDAPLGYHALFVNPFTDVSSTAWYWDDVAFGYTHGLFNGTTETTFSPTKPMTRGMLVTVLGRLHGIDIDKFKAGAFGDVETEAYYAAYVQWAYKMGIVKGTGMGMFAPDASITRQDLAVILYRFIQLADIALPKKKEYTAFSDNGDIADYAREAVEALYRAGIINGKSEKQFDPKGQATRAEVAAMLRRFILAAGEK